MRNDDIIDVEPAGSSRSDDSLRAWGLVSYLLHFIVAVSAVIPGAQASLLLLVIALVMDLVKRDDAFGTWHASHFRWRIRTVLWAGFFYVFTLPLFLLFLLPGMLAWAVISVWFLYRIVKGMLRMHAGRPMYAP